MTEKEAIKDLIFFEDKLHNGIFGYKIGCFDVAIKAIEEIQRYRAIGTAEECREAMERKMPQKPKREVLDKDLKIGNVAFKAGTRVYLCPSCGKGITGSDAHCRWCGQAILWKSDDEH